MQIECGSPGNGTVPVIMYWGAAAVTHINDGHAPNWWSVSQRDNSSRNGWLVA